MTRRVLSALLALTVVGCDHPIGTDDLPEGNTPIPTQLTANLRAVFAVSDQEVYVVGEQGTVARYNGTDFERFQIEGVSEADFLNDVAAADTGEVVVSGGTPQETPLLLILHAGTWSVQANPPGVDNFYVGRLMSTLHFGSENPKRVVLAGGLLRGGSYFGYASSYAADGTFTPVQVPTNYPFFRDVVGIGATLYFRHVQGILEVNASSADFSESPYQVNTPLVGLSEGRDMYMFGFGGNQRFYTLKDYEWTSVRTELSSIRALDGRTINDLYAVGAQGGFFHFDGTSWTALDSGTQENLSDVHVLPNGHVYVVGDKGTFFVYVP